jgi:hypothetical protein
MEEAFRGIPKWDEWKAKNDQAFAIFSGSLSRMMELVLLAAFPSPGSCKQKSRQEKIRIQGPNLARRDRNATRGRPKARRGLEDERIFDRDKRVCVS